MMRKTLAVSLAALAFSLSLAPAAQAQISTSSPAKNICYDLRTDLRLGSKDVAPAYIGVQEFRDFLSAEGYSLAPNSGDPAGTFSFSSSMQAALADFQAKLGLNPSVPGALDAATRAKIKSLTCNPSNSPAGISHLVLQYPNSADNLSSTVPAGKPLRVLWTFDNLGADQASYFVSQVKDYSVKVISSTGEETLVASGPAMLSSPISATFNIPSVSPGTYAINVDSDAYDGDVYSASSKPFSVTAGASSLANLKGTPSISINTYSPSLPRVPYYAPESVINYKLAAKYIPSNAVYSFALKNSATSLETPLATFGALGTHNGAVTIPSDIALGNYSLRVTVSLASTTITAETAAFPIVAIPSRPGVSTTTPPNPSHSSRLPAFTATCAAGIGPYRATVDPVTFAATVTPNDPNLPVPAYTFSWGNNQNAGVRNTRILTGATPSVTLQPYKFPGASFSESLIITDPTAHGSAAKLTIGCQPITVLPADSNPAHSPADSAPLTISCIAKDAAGNPIAGPIPVGTEVVWTAALSNSDPAYSYVWKGTDHIPSGGITSTITYAKPGIKTATFAVKKNNAPVTATINGNESRGAGLCPSIRVVKKRAASASMFDAMRSFWDSL